MIELKEMMDNNNTVLSQIVERTSHFRIARASHAPQSIFDMSFATQSLHLGDGGSMISSTFFSFDNEIVNSQAYRRALAKAFANNNNGNRTQSAGSDHGADLAADRVLASGQQMNTELDSETIRLSEVTRSPTVSDTPILSPTPSDPLMAFMSEAQTPEQDWATTWAIKKRDIEGVRHNEVKRQKTLHEIITTERTSDPSISLQLSISF